MIWLHTQDSCPCAPGDIGKRPRGITCLSSPLKAWNILGKQIRNLGCVTETNLPSGGGQGLSRVRGKAPYFAPLLGQITWRMSSISLAWSSSWFHGARQRPLAESSSARWKSTRATLLLVFTECSHDHLEKQNQRTHLWPERSVKCSFICSGWICKFGPTFARLGAMLLDWKRGVAYNKMMRTHEPSLGPMKLVRDR